MEERNDKHQNEVGLRISSYKIELGNLVMQNVVTPLVTNSQFFIEIRSSNY